MRETVSLKKSLCGAACISIQPLLLNALSLPVMAYTIRRLGAAEYGHWATSAALVAAGMMLANPGLRAAFVRTVALNPDAGPRALAEQLGLRLLLCALATVAVLAATALLGYSSVVLHCAAVGAVGAVATTVATVLSDLLQARHRLPAVAATHLVAGLALTLASLLAVWLGAGPVALAVAYLVGPVLAAAGMGLLLRRERFPVTVAWDGRRFLAMLKEARSFAAQQLVAAGGTQVHALLLSRLVTPAAFGYFTAGSMPGSRLTVIPDGLCTAAYPAIAQAYRRSPAEGAKLATRYLALTLLLCLSAVAGVTLVSGWIARLLFPDHWLLCAQVIRITVWTVPAAGVALMMGYALNAAGKEAQQARALVPAGVCGLLINVLLVVRFGLLGACWAVLVPHLVNTLFLLPCYLRTFGTAHLHAHEKDAPVPIDTGTTVPQAAAVL